MQVEAVWRYPVKSMLGEQLTKVQVGAGGIRGDRQYAVLDAVTGTVASAKQPRRWRSLLAITASHVNGTIELRLPGEPVLSLDHPDVDDRLSAFLGRSVRVSGIPTAGANIDRADPEQVLDRGLDAEVSSPKLVLGQAVPEPTFLDYAPLHLISTATLEHVGTHALRYRPNLVLRTPPGAAPYAETAWVGSMLTLGDVVLQVILPTPRCAVPVLAHGTTTPDPNALRILMRENRIHVAGFGVLPAAGVYATVQRPGTLMKGTDVTV